MTCFNNYAPMLKSNMILTVVGLGSRILAIKFLAPAENHVGHVNWASEICDRKKEY